MRYGEFMIERLVGRLAEMSTRNSTPKELAAAMYEAVQVIEQLRKAAAPPPNAPMTLEQLMEMEGEPVWLRGNGLNRWYIFDGFSLDGIAFFTPGIGYGKMWAAYRRRPEEGTR